MTAILKKIETYKREEVAARKTSTSLDDLICRANEAPLCRGFFSNLQTARQQDRYGLICEIKRASPSKGLIREDFDPPQLAKAYQEGGATCLSVLTDTPSFQGSDEYLMAARGASHLPVIRKEFFYDSYQVVEARAIGADCILIIMAAITDDEARALSETAGEWGLDILIEIHDERELERALNLPSKLIGINNRDLNTFETDLAVTERLAPQIPEDYLIVGESGLRRRADLDRLAKRGVTSFLIGESLMRQPDVASATRDLLTSDSGEILL